MYLSRKDFELSLLKAFKEKYQDTSIIDGTVKVSTKDIDITFSIEGVYQSYIRNCDFEDIKSSLFNSIGEMMSSDMQILDYNAVYPFVKSKHFNPCPGELIREHLFLDIDICYVSNLTESFRFVLKSDTVDFDKLKNAAFKNLNILGNSITKVDANYEIYSIRFTTDFAATLILSSLIKRQIINKIGRNFIFCIPSSSAFFIATDTPQNARLLNLLVQADMDGNKISNNIYRHRSNGIYEYAYKSEE